MSTRVLAAAMVAVLLTWAGLPAPAAAQGVGAIGGTVSDASGAALPGVSVTLSNPGVIGGDQQTVTDERGAYQFNRLVPGAAYSVRAALQGFRSALQEKIVVNSDTTSRVDLHLEIGALEETITVSGQAPLLDTTQTLKQTVMTRETLDALPSRSDVWAIARTAPAVIMNKYDVGGSEMFSQSFAQIYGSTNNERAYTIDGMDVTWAGGEGFVISYLDAHMFEEINLQTASGVAESAKGGLITNMVTKTGSNRFIGSYNFAGGGENTSWNNLSGKRSRTCWRRFRLARAWSIPISCRAPRRWRFSTTRCRSADRLSTTSCGSQSPARSRRWINSGWAGTTSMGRAPRTRTLMRNISTKVSWQARRASQLHVLYNFNNKGQFNRIENTGPITDFIDGDATIRQVINSNIVQTKWTSVLRNDLLLDASASYLHGDESGRPQDSVQPGSIPTFDLVRREHTVAPPNFLHRPATRVNVLSSLAFHVGSHDLKAGYQLMYRKAGDTCTGVVSPYAPFGFRRVLRNGLPDSVNTYNTPTTFVMYSHDHAGYIQDRWTPTRKLTLNLGLRLESTYASEPSLCQQETTFIAAQCFSKIDGVPSLMMPSPRLGAIYDVAGDGKTAIKLTINRYNQPIGVNYLQLVNPVRLTNDTRLWTDGNNDLVPQLNELGPSTGFNLGTTNRFADDLKWPYAIEYSVGVQRSLPYEMVAGLTYINRRRGDEIGSRNLAVPTDSYIPLTVREVASGAEVTVYDQAPSLRGKFDVLYGNYSEMATNFNGLDITLNKRLSHRWMMMGSASFGRSKGDIYGNSFDLNDPNNSFRRGLIGNDVPFSFKLFGMYQLPYGVSFSGTVQHFTGFPELTTVSVGANTVGLTRVTQRVTVQPRGTTRLPDVNLIDFSIRKSFSLGRYSVEPIMDMFNVANSSAIRARSTQLGPSYGVASDVVRGRIIKFGLNVKF